MPPAYMSSSADFGSEKDIHYVTISRRFSVPTDEWWGARPLAECGTRPSRSGRAVGGGQDRRPTDNNSLQHAGQIKILTGRLDDDVRIKVESEESFSPVRCSVLMLRIFENEHSHKYVDPNMEKIRSAKSLSLEFVDSSSVLKNSVPFSSPLSKKCRAEDRPIKSTSRPILPDPQFYFFLHKLSHLYVF